GKITWEEGDTESSQAHLQRAVALAAKANDLHRKCWANLWLLTLVADRTGPDAALPILSEIRSDVIKLGDSRLMSAFHAFAAQMDAKRGLFRSALLHVRASSELLRAAPNLWLEALLEYTQSNIAVLSSEHDAALEHGRRAVDLAQQCGAAGSLATCLASLGLVFYSLGRFDDAANCLSRAIGILPLTGDSHFGMIDTLAKIRLTQGDIESCERLFSDSKASNDSGNRLLYGHRYLGLTRAQLLGRQHDYAGALRQIDETLHSADAVQDCLLARTSLVTKAQLLQESGSVEEAVKLLD